jgi:hypothetical protein
MRPGALRSGLAAVAGRGAVAIAFTDAGRHGRFAQVRSGRRRRVRSAALENGQLSGLVAVMVEGRVLTS